jgi:hypothetical protein
MATTLHVSVRPERPVEITIHGPDEGSGPTLIGYLEITAVPKGARVEGWHGKDDSPADHQMILHKEGHA